MEFKILGPVEAIAADGLIVIPPARVRTLLAVLLARPGRVLSASELVDAAML